MTIQQLYRPFLFTLFGICCVMLLGRMVYEIEHHNDVIEFDDSPIVIIED
jgi:hypothetical protein